MSYIPALVPKFYSFTYLRPILIMAYLKKIITSPTVGIIIFTIYILKSYTDIYTTQLSQDWLSSFEETMKKFKMFTDNAPRRRRPMTVNNFCDSYDLKYYFVSKCLLYFFFSSFFVYLEKNGSCRVKFWTLLPSTIYIKKVLQLLKYIQKILPEMIFLLFCLPCIFTFIRTSVFATGVSDVLFHFGKIKRLSFLFGRGGIFWTITCKM